MRFDVLTLFPEMVEGPLRASIISLSIWVAKHTALVIRNQEEFEPLIEINRMIMQGLSTRGAQAAA